MEKLILSKRLLKYGVASLLSQIYKSDLTIVQWLKHRIIDELPVTTATCCCRGATLVKLTDDVNRMIHEAEKKRPDKRIGILMTPHGLFFRYNSNTPATKEWLATARDVTDENVVVRII